VRNAFDDALIASLTQAFSALNSDAAVKVVVLGGNGPAFCAGADLNWMKRMAGYGHDENLRDARALAAMLATLDGLDKPTIARVHGPAFAGRHRAGGGLRHRRGNARGEVLLLGSEARSLPCHHQPLRDARHWRSCREPLFPHRRGVRAEEALRIGLLSTLVPAAELGSGCRGTRTAPPRWRQRGARAH